MVFFTQAGCSLAAFYFGRIACMTMVQIPSYSLPLAFVTPVQAALCAVLSIYKQDQTIPSSEANLYYFMSMKVVLYIPLNKSRDVKCFKHFFLINFFFV